MIQRKTKVTYSVEFLRGGVYWLLFVLKRVIIDVHSCHTHLGESDYFEEIMTKLAGWWLSG